MCTSRAVSRNIRLFFGCFCSFNYKHHFYFKCNKAQLVERSPYFAQQFDNELGSKQFVRELQTPDDELVECALHFIMHGKLPFNWRDLPAYRAMDLALLARKWQLDDLVVSCYNKLFECALLIHDF